jgi:hypothetical protein
VKRVSRQIRFTDVKNIRNSFDEMIAYKFRGFLVLSGNGGRVFARNGRRQEIFGARVRRRRGARAPMLVVGSALDVKFQ